MAIEAISGVSGIDTSMMVQSIMKKVDTDKNGAISSTEFQTSLNKANNTSQDYSSVFSYLDSNADNSINQSELETGLNNVNSTGNTSSSQNTTTTGGTTKAGGVGGAGGAGGVSGASDSSGSSTSLIYDVRDTNQDGVVSLQEELAYQLKHMSETMSSDNSSSSASQEQYQTASNFYLQNENDTFQSGLQNALMLSA